MHCIALEFFGHGKGVFKLALSFGGRDTLLRCRKIERHLDAATNMKLLNNMVCAMLLVSDDLYRM